MGIFRAPKPSADAALAIAASEQIAARMLGSPLSLGARLVTGEIIGGRAAPRQLVTSTEAFRLGVIGAFTLTALLKPDIRALGILLCASADIAAAYRSEPLGSGRIPLADYLTAFGVELLPEGDIGLIRASDTTVSVRGPKRRLAIVHDARSYDHLARLRQRIVVHPIVNDDGTTARMVDR